MARNREHSINRVKAGLTKRLPLVDDSPRPKGDLLGRGAGRPGDLGVLVAAEEVGMARVARDGKHGVDRLEAGLHERLPLVGDVGGAEDDALLGGARHELDAHVAGAAEEVDLAFVAGDREGGVDGAEAGLDD